MDLKTQRNSLPGPQSLCRKSEYRSLSAPARSLARPLPFSSFRRPPFSLRASTRGAASAHQSKVELVSWQWRFTKCRDLVHKHAREWRWRSGAKSPYSARDQRRQHLDSFEGEWARSRESAIEGRDEKLEREHHLLGIKDRDNLFLRSPLTSVTTKQTALFVPRCLPSYMRTVWKVTSLWAANIQT